MSANTLKKIAGTTFYIETESKYTTRRDIFNADRQYVGFVMKNARAYHESVSYSVFYGDQVRPDRLGRVKTLARAAARLAEHAASKEV